MLRKQVRIGRVPVDALTREEAMEAVCRLVRSGRGGYVFTPNVDHVVTAERLDELALAYQDARLSLADGMPILWASRLLGRPLPEKLSGSDLLEPLVALAADSGWSVYFLGGRRGSCEEAIMRFRRAYPRLRVAGFDCPMMSLAPGHAGTRKALEKVRRADPEILIVGLSGPKQELLLYRSAAYLGSTLGFGLGAAIDFAAGVVPRAPAWMSRWGFEWLYRLWREPKRLWRRYLVRDPRFLGVVWRSLRQPRQERCLSRPLLPATPGSGPSVRAIVPDSSS